MTHGRRLRILLVTDGPAWPAVNGGRQRTALLFRALAELGDVDSFLLFDPRAYGIEESDESWRRMNCAGHVAPQGPGEHGAWRLLRRFKPGLADRLAHNFGSLRAEYAPDARAAIALERCIAAGRYDVIVGRYLRQTARSGALGHGPVVLDVDDLDTQVYRTRLTVPGQPAWKKMFIRRHLRQLERIIPPALAGLPHLWVAAERDRREIGHDRVTVLPNIPYAESYLEHPICPAPEPADCATVVMVGSMLHRVNTEGIESFLAECWPEIKRQHPAAVFKIAGFAMTAAQKAAWGRSEGVEPLGFVADLTALYAGAAVAVVPLFEGGGTKIKVLEAFQHGRVAAITRHAHRGYENTLSEERSAAVADTPAELGAAVVRLLRSPDERRARSREGWRLVNEHYSWPVFRRAVEQGIAAALGP